MMGKSETDEIFEMNYVSMLFTATVDTAYFLCRQCVSHACTCAGLQPCEDAQFNYGLQPSPEVDLRNNTMLPPPYALLVIYYLISQVFPANSHENTCAFARCD